MTHAISRPEKGGWFFIIELNKRNSIKSPLLTHFTLYKCEMLLYNEFVREYRKHTIYS